MARLKTAKIVYISDPHCPDHVERSLSWATGIVSSANPDYVVVGGDVFEADAASRFANEKRYDLLDEYKAGAEWLDWIYAASPTAEHVWTLGNHDFNIISKGRIDKRVRGACHWNASQWSASFQRWRQIPYDFSPRGVFELGQVIFWHGHDGSEDLNAIRINNACGGYAHRLVVGGHTHRPHGPTQVQKSKTVPLPLWHANAGTLGPTRPDWTTRQDTSLWAPAAVIVEAKMGRACQPGRNWDCRVEYMRSTA